MWLRHLWNLLARSWGGMVSATGTTTLGFIVWTLSLSAIGWAATVTSSWYGLKREKADRPFRQALRGSLRSGAFLAAGVTGLVVLTFAVFLIRTIYDDHQWLVRKTIALTRTNASLAKELEIRKHSMVTGDPVFPNTIYLLEAFNVFRHLQNGKPCVISLTATPDSAPMASMVAQFSNSVSGCFTFGPLEDFSLNPDLEKQAMNGMVPDTIVFHAAREDRPANELFMRLGNLMPLKRSFELPSRRERARIYKIPNPGQEDLVWLQFGTNVQWNSFRRQQQP